MTRIFLALSAAAPLVVALPATAAAIQKCLDWEGTVVYQDTPCPKGTAIGAIPRDTSRASPEAIRQAEEDSLLLARILVAKAARGAARNPGNRADMGNNPDFDALPLSGYDSPSQYGYGPSAYGGHGPAIGGNRPDGLRRARGGIESAHGPITRPPAILDSPSPCSALSCARATSSGYRR